jgi:hypothetical protein
LKGKIVNKIYTEEKYKKMGYKLNHDGSVTKSPNHEKWYPKKSKKPLKAIKKFCLECMGFDRNEPDGIKFIREVHECTDP